MGQLLQVIQFQWRLPHLNLLSLGLGCRDLLAAFFPDCVSTGVSSAEQEIGLEVLGGLTQEEHVRLGGSPKDARVDWVR